jgi:hypothetical protein
MMQDFLKLVDPALLPMSGRTFYTGRTAFAQPADIYLLGLNPGGDPEAQADETIARDISLLLNERPEAWSAYADESWRGFAVGAKKLQRRVQHLCRAIGEDPRAVPASNVIFVRTTREAHMRDLKRDYLRACWPVHRAVIDGLGVKVIVCMGATAGAWVREMVGASTLRDRFVEDNARRWVSETFDSDTGPAVVTLTHGSIADWTAKASDPSGLVCTALERARAK